LQHFVSENLFNVVYQQDIALSLAGKKRGKEILVVAL